MNDKYQEWVGSKNIILNKLIRKSRSGPPSSACKVVDAKRDFFFLRSMFLTVWWDSHDPVHVRTRKFHITFLFSPFGVILNLSRPIYIRLLIFFIMAKDFLKK